jgi:hypothetical protein
MTASPGTASGTACTGGSGHPIAPAPATTTNNITTTGFLRYEIIFLTSFKNQSLNIKIT